MIKKLASKLESFKQKCMMDGISDIIVVKDLISGQYYCTPFYICFARQGKDPWISKLVKVKVNDVPIPEAYFFIDEDGHLDPFIPPQSTLASFKLKNGTNDIEFILQGKDKTLKCEIHLFDRNDKLIISDVDGTLTKSDFSGMVNNLIKRNHLHDGYIEFVDSAANNGYRIVWLTMRSVTMYNFSKNYIRMYTKSEGPLFAWPEQILSALKKELTKKTIDPKTLLLKNIRDAFPENMNPFAGAFGNRENDAFAYTLAEIPANSIYLVDKSSVLQRWGSSEKLSYTQLSEQIDCYFPKVGHCRQVPKEKRKKPHILEELGIQLEPEMFEAIIDMGIEQEEEPSTV